MVTKYQDLTKPHRLINLRAQLKNPALIRIDLNLPLANGGISEDNLRMQIYSHLIEIYSEYTGQVLMTHQGRPGSSTLIPLKHHWIALRRMLPSDVDIEYIPKDEVFSSKIKKKIKKLKKREILLLDNMRLFREEEKFDSNNSIHINFFKGAIKSCVNDAMPTWHRSNSSMMCLPYIAKTFIGTRSSHELKALEDIRHEKNKALIMGGAKLQKISYLSKILKTTSGFTGGLIGQLILVAKGFDLGKLNNKFIKNRFTDKEFEEAQTLSKKFKIECPVDFTISEDGEKKNIPLKLMPHAKGPIMDIGEETLEKYANKLQEKEIRIRAGPLGIYERGYNKGVELTKRIAGDGLIFLGGDTSQEIIDSGIYRHILDSGGQVLISGGAFLHGLAGERYPSVDLIIEKQKNN